VNHLTIFYDAQTASQRLNQKHSISTKIVFPKAATRKLLLRKRESRQPKYETIQTNYRKT